MTTPETTGSGQQDRITTTAARRARCYECGKRRLVYPDLDGQRTCRRCNLRLFFAGRRNA